MNTVLWELFFEYSSLLKLIRVFLNILNIKIQNFAKKDFWNGNKREIEIKRKSTNSECMSFLPLKHIVTQIIVTENDMFAPLWYMVNGSIAGSSGGCATLLRNLHPLHKILHLMEKPNYNQFNSKIKQFSAKTVLFSY